MFNVKHKSRYQCTGIQVLSIQLQDKYLPKKKLLSKDKKYYVCIPCGNQIKKDKKPKKSEKDTFEYSSFPVFLKNHLKKVSNYMAIVNKKQHSKVFTEEMNIDQALQLNKLESHLLK